jgi:phage FluMu protein gp41
MTKKVFGINGKHGFVTIEPEDESIVINNNSAHITIKSVSSSGVDSLNGKRGDVVIGSSDGSLSITENTALANENLQLHNLNLEVTETGSVISDINWRINSLEQKGSFLGSFQGFTSIPTNISGYSLGVSVNDFIHVVEDETHESKTTQYIVSGISLVGDITYVFDLVLDNHAVSSVNAKTGDVVIGISDIAGLQSEIDNAKFNGNLASDLNIGDSNTNYKLKLNAGVIECSSSVANMKITASNVRVEGRLILGENQALWGSDDVSGLVNLMHLMHNDTKDVIHVGFHDFPVILYHAEWTGISDKNITVMKSYVENGIRVEKKEQLAYVSDLNNITGNLTVIQAGSFGSNVYVTGDARIDGDFRVGAPNKQVFIYSDTQIEDNLIVYKDLQVVGNISGKIDASNIASGIIDQQRLPASNMTNFNYYASNSGVAAPSWCKIITIYKPNEMYGPIKFNILGARGQASGWSPNFDEDYYIRVRYNGATVFETPYRNVNVSFGAMKLGFIRVDNNTTDAYLYRETADTIWGSILFNKYATDVITVFTNSPVLTTDPGVTFLPERPANIPVPPSTGAFTLKSNNGVLSWY